MKIRTIILAFLVTLSSCKEIKTETTEEVIPPISTFDSAFPKNNKMLSHILGNELTIKSGNDTLKLKIISNKTYNLIVDIKTGDTLFFGSVCKYRDLYYLNEKVSDSSYYISAFKIDGKLVFGLTNRVLQHYDVDDKITAGNNKKLVRYINSDTTVIRLRSDKKELKNLFTAIMDDVVPDTILNYDKSNIVTEESGTSEEFEKKNIENTLIVYPNPATEFINLEFTHKRKALFQLADINGKIVLQGKLDDLVNKIDISNQKPGIYFLTENEIGKSDKATAKIIIK
ncbi:MAG: T9SS type A sorting domain-containing protein [Pedobacter sp.]|nr:MAG: T9SS type A sorting domain-containing protein [Pedobacter sp.]